MKFICLILFVFSSITQAMPVDSNVFNLFPLNVGNRWTWYVHRNFSPGPGYEKLVLQNTQLINGHIYHKGRKDVYINYGNQHSFYDVYYRIDSLTGNLYSYDVQGNSDCLVDSLNSSGNDSAQTGCPTPCCWYRYDTTSYDLFNQSYPAVMFSWSTYFEGGSYKKYVKNFGFVYSHTQFVMSSTIVSLRGCIINGIVYGDTTVYVGINQISSEIPLEFSLSQNYPNPFNPSTKIKFQIPLSRGVDAVGGRGVLSKLSIYNSLGHEVEVLVNQSLQPGTYEVDWDASNYPSGVYFYELISGNFTQTRKMVLLK
jgi:hypothetical protein